MLMLVIRDKANIKIDYPVSTIANPDKTIFFDIETTGFSRKYCNVYLIGCMYFSNNELMYAQWLAENFNFKKKDIIRHYDITGKECPRYFVEHEEAWKDFVEEVFV